MSKRFMVRDESGRGFTTEKTQAALVEFFAEDYDDAHDVGRDGEDTESFADMVEALDVGEELRIDGATLVIRVR